MDTIMAKQATITRLTSISDAYGALALLLQLPTKELLDGLGDGTLQTDLANIMQEAGFSDEQTSEINLMLHTMRKHVNAREITRPDMGIEYTRLFCHPEHPEIPLFEEQYIWHRRDYAGKTKEPPRTFVNRAALDAERCYKAAGLVRSADMNIPADCMSTEMEFMQHLYVSKARALLDDDDETLVKTDAQIREFTHLHLEKWAKDFFADCATLSTCEVYQAVGLLGGMLVDWQLEQLKSSEADKGDCLPSQEAAQS